MRLATALAASFVCLLVAPTAAEASVTLSSTQRDFDTNTTPPGTLVIDVAGSAGLRIEHTGTAGTNYTLTATSGGPITISPPSISEAATVTFTIERRTAGRRVKGKCRKRGRANRKRKKCDLRLKGSFRHLGKAGSNSFRFSGRLRGRKLAPGRYNLVATARDAAGNGSKSKRARFRVVK